MLVTFENSRSNVQYSVHSHKET